MPEPHSIRDVDASQGTATCSVCGPVTPVRFRPDRSVWICKINQAAKRRARGGRREQERQRLLRYGLTVEQYDALVAHQGGACAICANPTGFAGRALSVDHDHKTGDVRGLLCGPCNSALGLLRDDASLAQRAAGYLRSPPAERMRMTNNESGPIAG